MLTHVIQGLALGDEVAVAGHPQPLTVPVVTRQAQPDEVYGPPAVR